MITSDNNIKNLILSSSRYTKETLLFFKQKHEFLRSGSLSTIKKPLSPKEKTQRKPLLKAYNIALNLNNKELSFLKLENIEKANIQFINLSNNRFREFPIEIQPLINLKSLKIDHNYIKTLPNWLFSSFKLLEILSIGDNLIKDLISIENNENTLELKYLDVSFNNIENLPLKLDNLKNLNSLRINNNHFLKLPISLIKLVNLKELTLDWFKYVGFTKEKELLFQTLKARFKIYFELTFDGFSALIDEGRLNRLYIEILYSFFNEKGGKWAYLPEILGFFENNLDFDLKAIESHTNQSLLHKAVLNEEIGIIISLISKEYPLLDLLDKENFSALSLAINKEHYFSAKLLLYKGASLIVGIKPIFLAMNKIQAFLIEDLLKFGQNPNEIDSLGNTPLHYLASLYDKYEENGVKILKMLIKAGTLLNCRNNDLWAPLHIGVKRGEVGFVKALLEEGANVNKRGGGENWTALHIAISIGDYEIIKLLLSYKADLYSENSKGVKPISYCKSSTILKTIRKHEKILIKEVFNNNRGYINHFIENSYDLEEEKGVKIQNLIVNVRFSRSKSLLQSPNNILTIIKTFCQSFKAIELTLLKYIRMITKGFSHYTLPELLEYFSSIKLNYYQLQREFGLLKRNSITEHNLKRIIKGQKEGFYQEITDIIKEGSCLVRKGLFELLKALLEWGNITKEKAKLLVLQENIVVFIRLIEGFL